MKDLVTVCEDTLRETELALEQATNDIEKVRELLHEQITAWRRAGWSWLMVKETSVWEAYEKIGGS